MIICCDTREQKDAHVTNWFDQNGIKWIRSKLYVGDYTLLHDQSTCVDRKKDMQEIYGNLIQQHIRFREELIRAREADIQLIVLIEDPHIKDIDMVYLWQNPRYFQWVAKGSKGRPPASSSNIMGIMKRMSEVYGVRWEFARHDQIGAKIVQLLGGC